MKKLTEIIKEPKTQAKIAITIIFLALIRCATEFYRLEYIHKENLTISQVKPFVLGSLIGALSVFTMVILFLL